MLRPGVSRGSNRKDSSAKRVADGSEVAKAHNKEWKLYWCETDDHDEDWFVVARNVAEAKRFHERAEGYDKGDARAELVCSLPASDQRDTYQTVGWPSKETLIACGAEFLPNIPQDGANELREYMGSGARVVRIKGRVYGEGDIVGNTLHRLRMTTES